uniref:uncharacterized protein LOC122602955 n=1 Tax=Erigeron canadensis TaxID=72917 RepID=UPI001CB950C2|nr:uncharacterized protein LOC122602955 [Erigeron canadensis]
MDLSKKSVPPFPPIHIQSGKNTTQCGRNQTFYTLSITKNRIIGCGNSKDANTLNALLDDAPISMHKCTNIRSNGMMQTNFIAPNGSLQNYWGLKITDNDFQPNIVQTQEIQDTKPGPSNTCALSPNKGVSNRRSKQPIQVNDTEDHRTQFGPNDVSKGQETQTGPNNASVQSGPSNVHTSFPKKGVNTRKRKHPIQGFHVSYLDLGPPTYLCTNCNALMWYEERCKNTKLDGYPKFASQEGKILLPKLLDAPEPLKTLLDYEQPGSSKFKDDIRTYNSMFCFTSFGAKIDHSINQGRNLYTFRISGQNYHRIGSLLPVEGEQPRYAQLYFYDTANETRNRMSAFMSRDGTTQRVDEVIVAQLIQMLDNHSSLSRAFRMARDWCVQNNNNNCELRLLGQRTDMRQYNKPTVSEVAVLITNDFGENIEPRDIIVSPKNGGLRRISELHQLYMALQYPLLFPYGETGYHPEIPYHKNTGRRKTKRNTVTMREFYCYRIHYRSNEGTTLFRGGRLYQQYLVDSYTAVHEERLRWTRNHQPELRAELYNNICDAVT